MLRPVGRSRWGMAACLAAGLGGVLAGGAAAGHPEWGSAMALSVVLTAVPALPQTWRPASATMLTRGVTVVLGAAVAMAVVDHLVVLGAVTVVAAVVGAYVERVGPTAALAVVLVSIDVPAGQPSAAAVMPYVAGALTVGVAWVFWYLGARAVRRGADGSGAQPVPDPVPARGAHAGRVGVAVGAAVLLAGALPGDWVGGHWLVTSVLLTVQPHAVDTGLRMAQRLLGNAVGALIAAVLLGAHPGLPVVAGVSVALFAAAMALRPVNYTWWAVTGPPVLLVIGEYPDLFPWYEGGVRLAMNLAGAVIVVAVVFAAPAMVRAVRLTVDARFTSDGESDSVSKNS